MSNVFGLIKYNLGSLVQFKGRDDRATFWPYAGVVVGSAVLVMLLAMSRVFRDVAAFAQKHPGQARIDAGPGRYTIDIEGNHPELAGLFGDLITVISLLFGICTALLAAAVARRLHDTGRSGAWGLIPVPFIMFSCSMMARAVGRGEPQFGLFIAVFASNLLYLASLGLLIVLLAKPSDATSNIYGLGRTGSSL